MPSNTDFCALSIDLLAAVTGGQSVAPPGAAGGRWSGAPSPGGGGGFTAPGMGIRDAMQGGAVSPGGGPTGGINTSPGGGSGGGGPNPPQAPLT